MIFQQQPLRRCAPISKYISVTIYAFAPGLSHLFIYKAEKSHRASNMDYFGSSVCKKLKANLFFSRFIHCHPFEWNEKKKLPQVVHSQWRIVHWYCNMSLAILNTCFVQFRSVQVFLHPESSTIRCIYMQLMAFWYMAASMMQLTFIRQRLDLQHVVANHMSLCGDIWDETGNSEDWDKFKVTLLLMPSIFFQE